MRVSALVALAVTLLFPCRAYAQEALVTLGENPAARPQPARARPLRNAWPQAGALSPLSPATLSLPFVDDFAAAHPWPDPALWTTSGVYVNSHYALNMPTIGVATFDALDAHGRLYPHLSGVAAPADTLTSLPVNIDMAAGSNIVLSFFYQPGGLGDLPGSLDRLRLEFNAPDTNWTEVWRAAVNVDSSAVEESYYALDTTVIVHRFDTLHTQFVYVMLAIKDDAVWRRDGFQFRFINDVSLTVNTDVPGRANNADFWHLDFVYLNEGRSIGDSLLPDVGMVRPQTHLTIGYSSIPAHHLLSPSAASVFPDNTTFNIAYRNLGMGTQNVYRRFAIRPVYGTNAPPEEVTVYPGGGENIFNPGDPNGDALHERTFEFAPYDFTDILPGAADVAYEVSSYLLFDAGTPTLRRALRHNDTTRYIQEFHDYYAYDDGSAENGYGLFGYGTANGRVAVPFTPVMADTLRGVYLYFNMAKDSANLKPFEVAVWDDNGGAPGNILRREKYSRPAIDSLNAYVAYKFNKPLPVAGNRVFYVGWIQSSEVFLNIGFDANTPGAGRNLYALGAGSWYESIYDGALMLRPIFTRTPGGFPGKHETPEPAQASAALSGEYLIYPNPATDWITIRNLKAEELGAVPPRPLIEIFDMSGRKHRTGYADGGIFSVSGLAAGMYIVRIIENETVKTSQKLIVN